MTLTPGIDHLRKQIGTAGMKFVEPSYADPEQAARKLVEIASMIEPMQHSRICIELINAPFLKAGDSPDEYRAGIDDPECVPRG
jgi:hypothetical protein